MTNKRNGTLYVVVTSDLIKRVYQHKTQHIKCFTSKYKCTDLVYYELFSDMENAIKREKQIKAGSRKNKLKLIEGKNKNWDDLYSSIIK